MNNLDLHFENGNYNSNNIRNINNSINNPNDMSDIYKYQKTMPNIKENMKRIPQRLSETPPIYPNYMNYQNYSDYNSYDFDKQNSNSSVQNTNISRASQYNFQKALESFFDFYHESSTIQTNEMIKNLLRTSEFLERYSGKVMKVDFLIGNSLDSKVGKLIAAGENYIILQILDKNAVIVCDSNCIKYITIVLDDDAINNLYQHSANETE